MRMNSYIGPKQRPIIEALKRGGLLWMRNGKWMLRSFVSIRSQNRERCMGLYLRGFVMHDTVDGWAIYRLTEKGKRA